MIRKRLGLRAVATFEFRRRLRINPDLKLKMKIDLMSFTEFR
jgi:hypothetical protein